MVKKNEPPGRKFSGKTGIRLSLPVSPEYSLVSHSLRTPLPAPSELRSGSPLRRDYQHTLPILAIMMPLRDSLLRGTRFFMPFSFQDCVVSAGSHTGNAGYEREPAAGPWRLFSTDLNLNMAAVTGVVPGLTFFYREDVAGPS